MKNRILKTVDKKKFLSICIIPMDKNIQMLLRHSSIITGLPLYHLKLLAFLINIECLLYLLCYFIRNLQSDLPTILKNS